MARGVNKVILIGNLGQDPEVRFTPQGTAVANVNLATTDTWMDKQSGQKQERTEWHRLVMFKRTAEIAQQYLTKGARIYVEGRLQTRKWQDQNGQDKYTTEIVVNDMQMLSSPNQGGQQYTGTMPPQGQQGGMPPQQGGHPQQGQQQRPPQGNPQQGGMPPQGNPNYGAPAPGAYDDFDDEIPFDGRQTGAR